jgi:glycerol-3-phosphate acyltransferase PlsX
MIWIAVDAMGGDEAPRNVVDGALAAVRHFDLGVLLVGRADAVGAELERHAGDRARVRIVEAADVVGMRWRKARRRRWSAPATRARR